jgi:23S rRNA (pseudouridine1915-N3)-methyltransferase
MKLSLIQVGKTNEGFISEGLSLYYSRIRKMMPLEIIDVGSSKDTRNKPESVKKSEEAASISAYFKKDDVIVLLDESGKQLSSRGLAAYLQKTMNTGPRRIVFVIGGAWGLGPELYEKANRVLSLSSMTFPHQLVRLLFAEQLYRALTIIKGIPYHHD